MSNLNQGFISGVLVEQPNLKQLENGMSMARVVIAHTAPGYEGKQGKRIEVELTAWGDAAHNASEMPAGANVICAFKLGSRSTEKNGVTYRNLTATVSSIAAIVTAKQSAPPEDESPSQAPPAGGDVPF